MLFLNIMIIIIIRYSNFAVESFGGSGAWGRRDMLVCDVGLHTSLIMIIRLESKVLLTSYTR